MTVLWRKKESNGRGIFEEIKQWHKVAYTTILTVVDRLVKKGFIRKEKKEDIFVFSPVFSEKEFNLYVTRKIMQGLLKLSSDSTIVSFADILSELDSKQVEELHALIETKMKNVSEKNKES